ERPGLRCALAKVEMHLRVDTIDDALVPTWPAGGEVFGVQAGPRVGLGRWSERADQIGNGVAVLFDRQPGQFHAWRLVPLAGGDGVEVVKNVRGHSLRLRPGAGPRIVLGHRLGDQLSKLRLCLIAGQRLLELLAPFAVRAVARSAALLIN